MLDAAIATMPAVLDPTQLLIVDEGTPVSATAMSSGPAPYQFEKLRSLIKPKPGGFDDLPWMTDLLEARKKAATEGKPLFVWVGDGHPLGWT